MSALLRALMGQQGTEPGKPNHLLDTTFSASFDSLNGQIQKIRMSPTKLYISRGKQYRFTADYSFDIKESNGYIGFLQISNKYLFNDMLYNSGNWPAEDIGVFTGKIDKTVTATRDFSDKRDILDLETRHLSGTATFTNARLEEI